jgi:penicillin-binding protein 1C
VDHFCKQISRHPSHILWLAPIILLVLFTIWCFILPVPLFREPTATVLLDRNQQLLGARLADDEQWRFPEGNPVPEKFKNAILTFEDRYFQYHPGINPVSLIRALRLNFKAGKIISGGSTITMQVIRLSRKNPPRTYSEKIWEMMLALRLEATHSKKRILEYYAAHAPFGGNVVGLEAAAWRYFGTSADRLSWGQTATLAVLPNAPALVFPGKNKHLLRKKRNRLLDELHERGIIDDPTCNLAKEEALPGMPLPLPQEVPQLVDRALKEGKRGNFTTTTLDRSLQITTIGILEKHGDFLKANKIYNAAALVLDVNNGEVLAYVGNLSGNNPDIDIFFEAKNRQPRKQVSKKHGRAVDIIASNRSTGSILKPLLYAAMLHDGLLLPNTLVPDVPIRIGSFMPQNFNRTYDGAVPAREALARSLNIPAVKMLQQFGYEPFYEVLQQMGMTSLTKQADHYGLSLILGGAESTLWEMTGIYASLARILNQYNHHDGICFSDAIHPPVWSIESNDNANTTHPKDKQTTVPLLDAGSIWLMMQAMAEVRRPEELANWRMFSSLGKIAWKTGTSFGNRDAWAIGITPRYVVGVWVGNATGEGRPGLTGLFMAAPVLFDIFRELPYDNWFECPYNSLVPITICRESGYRNGPDCNHIDTILIPTAGRETPACPWHRTIHLDSSGQFQVEAGCYPPNKMQRKSWFVLPPAMAWYYAPKHPDYHSLPSWLPGCRQGTASHVIEMIYPVDQSHIYIPVELDGSPGKALFTAAHNKPGVTLYWHLDKDYIGETSGKHQMAFAPSTGWHQLTIVDDEGNELKIHFEVLGDNRPK